MAHSIDDSEKRRSLIFIAKAHTESGKVDQAQQLFSEAIDMAHSIDDFEYKRYELASIAEKSQPESGKVDQAIDMAHSIDDSYYKSKALASIAKTARVR